MKNDKEIEYWSKIILWGIVLYIIFLCYRGLFGSHTIGDSWEKIGEYNTQYWVFLEPDSNSTKNYRVKADISKYEGDMYSIEAVYWPNGGHSNFDDCQFEKDEKKFYCRSDDDQGYTIRLGESAE